MQKSGFFNAIMAGDVPDRQYNAADYSDNLAVVISSGVLRSTNDDLKVTGAGMAVSVAAGRAWIKGHYYNNTDVYNFVATTAPTGGSRYDRVMLRLDESINGRSISLVYVQGTASNNPVPPEPTRDGDIYELVLADVYVGANATSVTVTDKRSDTDVCGWVYSTSGDGSFFTSLDTSFNEWFEQVKNTLSSVTLFKRYKWEAVLTTTTLQVAFNIPQYDAETCFIEVYVNGILDTDYALNNNVITFNGLGLVAGTKVTVYAFKSIDGTGIMDVADEITELQNKVAQLDGVSKFTYQCTGLNDNVSLSQIAQAFHTKAYVAADVTAAAAAFLSALGGNTYLAALDNEFNAEIDVVGKLGVTTPYSGSGTSVNYYNYFALDDGVARNRRLVFNFSKCDTINISITSAGTYNNIFRGTNMNVRNAKVKVTSNATAVNVLMVASASNAGEVYFENCNFKIETTGYALIARSGNFIFCNMFVKSANDYARCVDCQAPTGMLYLSGGTYYAYSANANVNSGVIFTGGGVSDAVTIAENINCPTQAITGYTQTYFVYTASGSTLINGVVSTLQQGGNATYRVVNNLIQRNKVR